MKEIIVRVVENESEAEMLINDKATSRKCFKRVSAKELVEAIKGTIPSEVAKKGKMHFIHPEIVAMGEICVMIRQDGRKRIVTYKDKAFNINFPNALYIVVYEQNRIKDIEAYCFKEWMGERTQLYAYPMPNMLHGNCICIGSAPREIKDKNYVQALENIIFTRYSHAHVDNIKSFRDTIPYFEYLENNPFPYELMLDLRKTIKNIM